MSEFLPRSFDVARDRPVPSVLRGRGRGGALVEVALRRLTLVAVIKPHCDGCRDFLDADLHEFDDLDVVVLSREESDEWDESAREVLVAPEFVEELEARGAPWYLVIDPTSQRVVTEGVLFTPAQVASEIAAIR